MANTEKSRDIPLLSGIYKTYLSNEQALKRYLSRFFYRAEDIDDMAQETFLKAYKSTQQREIEYPKAYLYQVAKSVAMRELGRKSRQMVDYMEEACLPEPEELHSLEEEAMAQQKLALFCDAVAELPPQCRRVFLMRKYQAMSQREIADELNISVSAVEQHITRGLKRCKQAVLDRDRNPRAIRPSESEGRR